jgi:hypothetical protein
MSVIIINMDGVRLNSRHVISYESVSMPDPSGQPNCIWITSTKTDRCFYTDKIEPANVDTVLRVLDEAVGGEGTFFIYDMRQYMKERRTNMKMHSANDQK